VGCGVHAENLLGGPLLREYREKVNVDLVPNARIACGRQCPVMACGLHPDHVIGQRSDEPCPILAARIITSAMTAWSERPAS
jgi:hypothetical protein